MGAPIHQVELLEVTVFHDAASDESRMYCGQLHTCPHKLALFVAKQKQKDMSVGGVLRERREKHR